MADKTVYTTTAVNTGARDGESHLTDGTFDVNVDTPKEMGGPGEGTNPEQLFALGYSACFHAALEHFKSEDGVDAESKVSHTVHLLKDPTDNGFKIGVEIAVGLEGLDEATANELVIKAHDFCPYSKAVKGNVDVTVNVVDYDSLN